MTPDVSVVIVTWNCREMVRTALRYLFTSETRLALQVILVDNDSRDGTPEAVATEFPQVEVVRSGGNLGFSRGNNLGFKQARGRHVLLLNPDAFLIDKTLVEDLVAWLDTHADYGALGCRITFPDGTHQVGDAGYRPTTKAMICAALGLNRLSSRLHGVFIAGGGTKPIDVDWICGAFMLVRRDVLERIGGFDESIFMYAEDVEWGCRARERGIRIAYLPWRQIVHVQNGTQYKDGQAKVSTLWLDNLFLIYRRLNQGAPWSLVRGAMAAGFLLRALVYRIASVLIARPPLKNKSRAMLIFARHVWTR